MHSIFIYCMKSNNIRYSLSNTYWNEVIYRYEIQFSSIETLFNLYSL